MKKRVTLKDIAKKANVSEASVSLVLNNKKSRISETKKREIKAIAKEMKYTPNRIARSLAMHKSYTIGLIIPDIENPYFSTLAKHVEDYLRDNGYLVFVTNSNDNFKTDLKLLQNLKGQFVDGILYCPANESYKSPSVIKNELNELEIPYVLIDRVFEEFDTNQVSFDNEHGGYIATKHLIESGFKNIACFSGDLNTLNGRHRYEGYLRAMKEHKIKPLNGHLFEGDYHFESGYKMGLKLIELNQFDSAFTSNDLMAYGLMKALSENNIKSFEIIGYDNLKLSNMFGISLDSVEQNIESLAHQACLLMLKQIGDNNLNDKVVLLPELAINSH